MTLNEFVKKYDGKQVEYHSYGTGALYQCVDLINAYINEVLDNNTKDYTEIIGTNAKDFATRYDPQDFIFIKDATGIVPQKGDIVIWNGYMGGGAGHVAIALEASTFSEYFKSLDQNFSKTQRVTLETHNYKNVIGWLRPINFKEEKEPVFDPTKNFPKNFREVEKLIERGLIEEDDALDTAFQKILKEDTRKDVLLKEFENEINHLTQNVRNHKEVIVELREDNQKYRDDNIKLVAKIEDLKEENELLDMNLEDVIGEENITNKGVETKTNSTNLDENVEVTLSTVLNTIIFYVQSKFK